MRNAPAAPLADRTDFISKRNSRVIFFAILAVAAAWRLIMAGLMPATARDGVTFVWYAQALERNGLAYLHDPTAQQHPLFPLLILGTHRIAAALGFEPADPWVWQRCGQVVSMTAGLLVIVLVAALARRLVRGLQLPLDAERAALFAAALAAILPLNIELSADAMSDQVHLAFYLAGVVCLVDLATVRRAAWCGAWAGLAFLTRPEGVVVLLAAIATIIARMWRRLDRPAQATGRLTALLVTFGLLATPFFVATGRLTPKKDLFSNATAQPSASPHDLDATAATEFQSSLAHWARLQTHDVPLLGLAPYALYVLFRAGRVVIIVLAIPPLVNLRKRWLDPPLIGLNACLAGHFLLTLVLLYKWDYLDPRHQLVCVMILIPFAAMLLARLDALAAVRAAPARAWICILAFAPLALYALRVPNADDAVYVRAAGYMQTLDPDLSRRLITGGNAEKRIAFYGGMRWDYWLEDAGNWEWIRGEMKSRRPDYLALQTGHGFERAGHDRLIAQLQSDSEIGPRLALVYTDRNPSNDVLHIFRLNWIAAPAESGAATAPAATLPGSTP